MKIEGNIFGIKVQWDSRGTISGIVETENTCGSRIVEFSISGIART